MPSDKAQAYTVTEAGAILGLPVKVVNKAIDEELPASVTVRQPSRRMLSRSGLFCLVVRQDIASQTPMKLRRALFKKIARHPDVANVDLTRFLSVDLSTARKELAKRLMSYTRRIDWIRTSADVLGGQPHFRGTRIPVFTVVDLLRQGVDVEQILEDYPRLTSEMIESAQVYAAAYPRRGRPLQPFWRATEPARKRTIKRASRRTG